MDWTRRQLIRSGVLGLGAALAPNLWARPSRANTTGDRAVVVLFLRGGADPLNLVVPRGDEGNYVALRNDPVLMQDITIPPGGPALELDGFFELHPSLEPLKTLFDGGDLAILHATGGTGDYSHFAAQDAMERAAPLTPRTSTDGWLNTATALLQAENCLGAILPLSGVGIGAIKPKSLQGPLPGVSISTPSLAELALSGGFTAERETTLQDLFASSSSPLLATVAGATFETLTEIESVASQPPGTVYPSGNGGLNHAFQDAARLVKNPHLGVKFITIDTGGWDHHSNEINNMNTRAADLAAALTGFWADIGSAQGRTLCLVMSEFGRTAAVNGGGGTDHGWGSLMFVLGGGVVGGRVLCRADPAAPGTGLVAPSGHWPGLGPGELHVQASSGQERDLKATIDFRDTIGEVLETFLALPAADVQSQVLRGYAYDAPGLFT